MGSGSMHCIISFHSSTPLYEHIQDYSVTCGLNQASTPHSHAQQIELTGPLSNGHICPRNRKMLLNFNIYGKETRKWP